jgi:multidrug efflux pump subunit AcrA (membrane-fusion protein)
MLKKIKISLLAITAVVCVVAAAQISRSASDESDLRVIPPRDMSYSSSAVIKGALVRDGLFPANLYFPESSAVIISKKCKFLSGLFSGEYVEAGDVIAEFTVDDNSSAIREAELNYELAKARLTSDVSAASAAVNGAVTELDKKAANAALDFVRFSGNRTVKLAEEALEAAKTAGEPLSLTAPVSGFVGSVAHSSGGEFFPGQIYCVINNPAGAEIKVTGDITSASGIERLAMLKFGAKVTIHQVRGGGKDFSGHVSSNTTLIGSTVRVAQYAVIAFDDPEEFKDYAIANRDAVSNSQYEVKINLSDINDAILCPRRAIQRENTYRYVYLLEDGMPKKRYILIGLASGDYVQVLDGLSEGDEVVIQ